MSTSADYVGLGPRVEDPAWVKMSSPTSGVSKKRKKPDTKPISQINKCLNEKRRREQENTYIEELAELTLAQLIKTGIASDMSSLSVKPDKCAILQQAVNQIRRIEGVEGSGGGAVQQGEVSSSKPSLIPNRQIAPILLEALDCFYFQVRNDGKIESVSDNVSQFIKFTSEDITGNSIYNIIHLGDHAKFSTCFLSIGWPTSEKSNESKNRRFNCRLLVKPPDDKDETIEEKQQRVSQYETMQICAVLQDSIDKSEGDRFEGENQQILFCLARRIPPNERVQGTPVEQFTTKLDTSGKIIDIDNSGLTLEYTHSINKDLIGGNYVELVHYSDVSRVTNHLQDTLREGHSTSTIYRVKQRGDPSFIKVQTKSKFFMDTDNSRPEGSFIMATHSIIGLPKEGSGASTNERSLAGTSGNGGVLEETHIGNRPSSTGAAGDDSISSAGDNNNRLRVLLQGSGEANEDSQNKILKGLLDQKEEDDGGGTGGGLNMDHILPQLTGSHQQQESTPNNNNMLRDLLNDDDDKGTHKKESVLWDYLDEKKPGEFMSPSSIMSGGLNTSGSGSNITNSMASSNSLSNPAFSTTAASSTGSGPPPRPSSADILLGSDARGIKRRSDEAHDGNPSKQTVMMGAFEKLLGPSPPTPSMSPVGGHGGRPPTPQHGPTTPHGAAPFTPHGPTTPQGRPLTPHGPSTPHTNSTTSNFSLGTGNSVPSPVSQAPSGQPSKLQEKNKMLVSLLTKEPAQTPPPTAVVPDPRGLPQEKLPKDLKEKLQTPGPWQGGRTDPVILNSLLKQPPSNPRQLKVNTSVAGQLLSGGPHSAPAHMLSQQPSLNSSGSLSQVGSSPLGNTLSGTSIPSSQAQQPGGTVGTTGVTGGGLINTINSTSGSTTGTTTLPSFSESMGLNPMGNIISTTGIPEGGLPSITTATSQFNPVDDNLHEMVINDILEMSGDDSSFSSQLLADDNKRQYTSPTYDQNENMAIQQIQNSLMLMSEMDSPSPNVTGAPSMPTYNIGVTSPSMSSGGYIPQYSPRGPGGGGNMSTMAPGGVGRMNMRPGAPQFSPNSQGQQRQPLTAQQLAILRRRQQQQEEHQLEMKRRLLQKQQMQQIQFSSSADVSQPPASTYNNIEDLFNNTVAPNVNVTLQRNVSESASPQSNYGMLPSPLGPSGAGGQQISPGQQQRIPQPPFSPHGPIASPLSNQQQQQSQYNNNLGNQMNYQNPQLSPRHPQGSPAPPNYPGSGGPTLPQISPTGPTTPVSSGVSPGQGSPAAWPRTSPQHQRMDSLDQRMDQQRPSIQAQNPILNAQLGSVHPNRDMSMMSGGVAGGRMMSSVRGPLPSMNRSMPSPNSRGQSPYIGPPTPGSNDGGPFPPSSPQQGTPPLMYQQQQQQQQQPQYRMQRTLSAPGQMPENKWGSENVNTSQGGPLSASPRMDDGRGSAGSEKGKSESMLKHLLSK